MFGCCCGNDIGDPLWVRITMSGESDGSAQLWVLYDYTPDGTHGMTTLVDFDNRDPNWGLWTSPPPGAFTFVGYWDQNLSESIRPKNGMEVDIQVYLPPAYSGTITIEAEWAGGETYYEEGTVADFIAEQNADPNLIGFHFFSYRTILPNGAP